MSALRDQVRTTARDVGVVGWLAFVVGAAFLLFVALMIAGSALADPGGWQGVGLALAWLVPVVGLVLLALWRPTTALPVLAVATLLPIAFGVWSLVDFDTVREWEDGVGPVSLVLLVVAAGGLVALGLALPTAAGILLLAATVLPTLLAMVGAGADRLVPLSIGLVSAPLVVVGVLDLVAGARRARTAGTGSPQVLGHLA